MSGFSIRYWGRAFLHTSSMAALVLLTCGAASAFDGNDYTNFEQDYRQLERDYAAVVNEYRQMETAYAEAEKSITACRTSPWSKFFDEPMKAIENERASLESQRPKLLEIRRSLEARRNELKKKNQDVNRRVKELGQGYWDELEAVTNEMRSDYMDPFRDKVIVGFQHYMAGIHKAIEFIGFYKSECVKPVPKNTLLKATVDNAKSLAEDMIGIVSKLKGLLGQ